MVALPSLGRPSTSAIRISATIATTSRSISTRSQSSTRTEVELSDKYSADVICDDITDECSVYVGGDVFTGDELKIEILVREDSGNQTATEACFEID